MPTSRSETSGDWLTATSTRSTALPGWMKSLVWTAWMRMSRSNTLLMVSRLPLTAGFWFAVWEI
ncbi:Uncharacterised protein [Mycobacterium tuberculosis]|nr:Uncharacterised protein [Mycobacterium tuberculosis]CNX27100.1 Uncharacterised protein [Mycobacterium tuberculosis]COV75210.1 Uncharacterised protein [Mycobacterium tuberculosis]COW29270.1 Uncharacterised protein [Mycobacterium tuberculosis]COY20782.1 Uncharacterised protein [Mycobacterium tuberculosis]